MGRRFQSFGILAALLIIAAVAFAQVRVDVRLVNVFATVTDAKGRYVSDLKVDDFTIEEDGAPQPINHFSQDVNVPVSIGILLDTSGSMQHKIRTAVDAVDRFSRRIHEDDDIFLITFSGRPILRQDFTDDRDKISQALQHITPTGGTALYDALSEGLSKIRSGRHYKRAILVITDGQDTASSVKLDELVQSIREAELLVYPVGISPRTYARLPGPMTALLPGKSNAQIKREDEVDINVLRTFAENSGGRAFLLAENWTDRGRQIEKVLDTISEELRSQYTLGFYPSRPDDGRYHTLRVRTRTSNIVRARRGYVAIAP
jgi:Ca-activated chloride channel family protein